MKCVRNIEFLRSSLLRTRQLVTTFMCSLFRIAIKCTIWNVYIPRTTSGDVLRQIFAGPATGAGPALTCATNYSTRTSSCCWPVDVRSPRCQCVRSLTAGSKNRFYRHATLISQRTSRDGDRYLGYVQLGREVFAHLTRSAFHLSPDPTPAAVAICGKRAVWLFSV